MIEKTSVCKEVSAALREISDLLKRAEEKIAGLKEYTADLEVDENHKSKAKKLQDKFIDMVVDTIDYWCELPKKTLRERMEGFAFSILVTLDGESGDMPPYAVRPLDEDGDEGEDIAGCLHELFSQRRKKEQDL
jgi:hypothetical protein